MAASAVAAAAAEVVTSVPWLVKRWEGVTTEADTVVFTHGETSSPDLIFLELDSTAVPTADAYLTVSNRKTSATTFTIDCEDDGNDTFTCVAIWFSQASGGIS